LAHIGNYKRGRKMGMAAEWMWGISETGSEEGYPDFHLITWWRCHHPSSQHTIPGRMAAKGMHRQGKREASLKALVKCQSGIFMSPKATSLLS
jgi:hypothetical protein